MHRFRITVINICQSLSKAYLYILRFLLNISDISSRLSINFQASLRLLPITCAVTKESFKNFLNFLIGPIGLESKFQDISTSMQHQSFSCMIITKPKHSNLLLSGIIFHRERNYTESMTTLLSLQVFFHFRLSVCSINKQINLKIYVLIYMHGNLVSTSILSIDDDELCSVIYSSWMSDMENGDS